MAPKGKKAVKQPRTVLITGASSGFGRATAELLAEQGHQLILIARRKDRLQALKQSLKTDVYITSVDVTNKAQVTSFFEHLPKKYQVIDVLINNAGLALGMEPAQKALLSDWERMIDTNIKGLLYITRPILDDMASRGSGLIINIGSVAAEVPYKGSNVYGATKAFVRQFSRNLRTDLLGTAVKVTNIEPGMAETEFSEVRFRNTQKAKAYYAGTRPLRPDNIAATIAWIMQQPAHVNIDNVEIMPVDQAPAGFVINRYT